MSWFLWGIYPYLCLAGFFVIPVLRMKYRPFSWSTRPTGLFGANVLGLGSLLLHWGLVLLFLGHLAGLIGGLLGREAWVTFFYWTGLVGGVAILVGSVIVFIRRLTVPEVRAMSQADDFVVHVFLIAMVGLALYQVLVDRIFGVAYPVSGWVASLWRFSPQPELLDGASLISKVHIFLAVTFLAYFPFTKLVHFWTYPINYVVRPLISMRTQRFRFQRRWELSWRSDKSWLTYGIVSFIVLFVLCGSLLGAAQDPSPPKTKSEKSPRPGGKGRDLLSGYPLYVSQCARCHGLSRKGDGPGASSPIFSTRPRDLDAAPYHFVSTENGIASDEDLQRTIRHGLTGSGMPPFPSLSDGQVRSLVAYLNSVRAEAAAPAEPVAMGDPPQDANGLLERGRDLFSKNCTICHGKSADGRGTDYREILDSRGQPIRPANLRDGPYKTGRDARQVFLRISTGIPGGKSGVYLMPPFKWLPRKDRWALVTYLGSLSPDGGGR